MQIYVNHVTRYRFAMPPYHGLQRLRLQPKSRAGQTVLDWTLEVEGAAIQARYDDHNDNATALVSFAADARDITVTCRGLVDTADNGGIAGPHAGCMPLWAYLCRSELTRPGPRLRALAARFRGHAGGRLEQLHTLSAAIREAVVYAPGQSDATTPAEVALTAGRGVCQDHAHIFVGAARLLDIPARYVSGYLLMDDMSAEQAGHGWAEAHVDELGWVGFDVANGVSPDDRYIRVAAGFDYHDAAPVTGMSLGTGGSELSVELSVSRGSGEQQQGSWQDAGCQQQADPAASLPGQ